MKYEGMKKFRRVLAIVLTFALLINVAPGTVSATIPEKFLKIIVEDENNTVLENASVEYQIMKDGDLQSADTVITDADGAIYIDIASYEADLEGGTISVNYTINMQKYQQESGSIPVSAVNQEEIVHLNPVVFLANVDFNREDALREDMEGQMFVFAEATPAALSTRMENIRLNYNDGSQSDWSVTSNSILVTETVDIQNIELYYTDTTGGAVSPDWHEVEYSNLKIVYDTTGPAMDIIPETSNANGYYNHDVTVKLKAEDPGDYSGIQKVEYWIECDNVDSNAIELYSYEEGQTILNKFEKDVTVSATAYNSENIKIHLKATDRAGNEETVEKAIKINSTEPVVEVNISGSKKDEAEDGYYAVTRSAIVKVKDRADTFDEEAFFDGIIVTGSSITKNEMISKRDDLCSTTDEHAYEIVFQEETHYEWGINYTNKAGLSNDSIDVTGTDAFDFVVDTVKPNGKLKCDEKIWDKVLKTLTLGLWKKSSITVSATEKDEDATVSYLKTGMGSILTGTELEEKYKNDNASFSSSPIVVDSNEEFIVYARFLDKAGNITYVSTEGIVYDGVGGKVEFYKETPNENGYYNDDVDIEININELTEETDGVASGIKSISYSVFKDYQLETQTKTVDNQSLFSDNIANPTPGAIEKQWRDSITVDAKDNNSDRVHVVVYVEDRAGNTYEGYVDLAINCTKPEGTITFTDEKIREKNNIGYYNATRSAIVAIKDRAGTFDEGAATKGLKTSVTYEGEAVALEDDTVTVGSWTHEGDVHTAVVTFNKEGSYKWNPVYTNKADLSMGKAQIEVGESDTPFAFVIDKQSPNCSVSCEGKTWTKVLEKLTFGLWKNTKMTVEAEAEDTTSGVYSTRYYKTDSETLLTDEQLKTLYLSDTDESIFIQGPIEVDNNEKYVVYVCVEDYSGNLSFVSTECMIYDSEGGTVELEFEKEANENGYYNSDVDIKVVVDETKGVSSAICAGIKTVDYKIITDGVVTEKTEKTENGNGNEHWFVFNKKNPTQSEIVEKWNDTITVNSKINNSDDVQVEVTAVDNSGNAYSDTIKLKINSTVPTATITFKDKAKRVVEGEGCFNDIRTAEVEITDRNSTFDEEAATKGLKTSVTYEGEAVALEDDTVTVGSWTHEGDKHKTKVTFNQEGHYTWDPVYTNKADLSVTSEKMEIGQSDTPFAFVIDKQSPNCSVSCEGKTWTKVLEKLTFGLWKNTKMTVEAEKEDTTSGVYSTRYYKTDSETLLTDEQLKTLYLSDTDESIFIRGPVKVDNNEKFIVYVCVEDNSGNLSFVSTECMIYDSEGGTVELEFEKEANENGYYNSDVNIKVVVDETKGVSSAICAGIKTVDYKIITDGVVTEKTENGNGNEHWFEFNKKNPTQSEIVEKWNDTITVNAERNNSDDVQVEVTAVDNSGNAYSDTIKLKINSTVPTATVKFEDRANKVVGGEGYFNDIRTAEVEITDRNSTFDEEAATKGLKTSVKYEGKGVALEEDTVSVGPWTHEGDKHKTKVTFNQEGHYTWDPVYTNKADLSMGKEQIEVGESVTPFAFAVDKTEPTASVKMEGHFESETGQKTWSRSWSEFLNKITFHLFDKKEITVSINDVKDAVTKEPIVEYFVTSETELLSASELDTRQFEAYNGEITISNEKIVVVYAKITDYSGNYIYRCSNGAVIDKTNSTIELLYNTPDTGIFNEDFNVEVRVKDAEPSSGIKSVEYWIEKVNEKDNEKVLTQSGVLYAYKDDSTDSEFPSYAEVKKEFGYSAEDKKNNKNIIPVDTNKNNSCKVVLHVKSVDNAGNEYVKEAEFDIDITKPTINVTYDNNNFSNKEEKERETYYYFREALAPGEPVRTATVVITERTNHFDEKKATEQIRAGITATNYSGNVITDAYEISEWDTNEGKTPDVATHTAVVRFVKDANYTFNPSYTDNAGNDNADVDYVGVAPEKFTIDTKAPNGTLTAKSVENRSASWSDCRSSITYGFWSRSGITVSKKVLDEVSPIDKIEYYKHVSVNANDKTSALKKEELDLVTEWQAWSSDIVVKNNQQFVVYMRVTDKAGNYAYYSTDGLIVDENAPVEEMIAPEITISPQQPVNGIYNRDVRVDLKVTDPLAGGTYSGLKNVSYKVFNLGEETQKGTLYSFNKSDPKQEDLLRTWTGAIVVDSRLNNSNDVVIEITATDNSGNTSTRREKIKIDITRPTINITYDNNQSDSNTFFDKERTATIVITERNFNSKDVIIDIKNTDGVIPGISGWSMVAGSGNLDDTKWITTITYSADGDYTFDITYSDLAGNKCEDAQYGNSVAPKAFTIDKTKPVVSVSYDNNTAQNSNYYKEDRIATITVEEHNFVSDRVEVTLTATDDGVVTSVPRISDWTTLGDKHTATIAYTSDALYNFDISLKDMAGNSSEDYVQDVFYIDKTAPALEITGVGNNTANSGVIAPVVSYSDTNFDVNQVTISLTGANHGTVEVNGKREDTHNGQVFTFKDFENKKEVDDIYTLKATLVDKAGNSSEQIVSFSINRFGSTYQLSKSAQTLNNSYVKIGEDITFTEINANELKNIKIVLFKNNKTIILKEGEDFEVIVEGGNGQWYKYTYTIFAKNFSDDGVYRLSIHSEDEAGNIAENTLDTKGTEISFGVDSTSPTLVVTNLESGETYPVENKNVNMSADDNLALESVEVYLDDYDKVYKSWNAEEIASILAGENEFEFEISGDSTKAHKVKVVCTDAAGNETTEEITDFYVTTDVFVRYYNNKPLFFGSIGGVILVAAGIITLVVLKRKKEEKSVEKK